MFANTNNTNPRKLIADRASAARAAMRRLAIANLAGVAALALAGGAVQAEKLGDRPAHFVTSLTQDLVAVQDADHMDDGERKRRLHALLRSRVDFEAIGQSILGDHWAAASAEQRREYQELFSKFMASTFFRRLNANPIEDIAVVGAKPVASGHALVHTRVERAGGQTRRWIWRLEPGVDGYQAVDLVMGGVSLTKTYRAEVSSLVSSLGMGALLEVLRFKLG